MINCVFSVQRINSKYYLIIPFDSSSPTINVKNAQLKKPSFEESPPKKKEKEPHEKEGL